MNIKYKSLSEKVDHLSVKAHFCIDWHCKPFFRYVPPGNRQHPGRLFEPCGHFSGGHLLRIRVGEIKKPAKGTSLSFVSSQMGAGKSFAILKFLDQIGAFAGPVLLFAVLCQEVFYQAVRHGIDKA
ncbi:hypothetical protein [Oscillibacter sp.]|uniref:hypothetical protein n=1 Tax=Oscillibacter sp. TaxID=1945593 RepID=UPI00339B0709